MSDVRFRDSAFLIAAVALPLVVVVLFLAAAAIPRWTVAPPAYDLILRADGGYNPANASVIVAFRVRDGRLEADLQPAAPNTYPQRPSLYLFDRGTLDARELPFDLPAAAPENPAARTIVVPALADRRIIAGARAPDGYTFEHRPSRGPGLVGEIFGMNRYGGTAVIVKDSRVVPIELPPYQYAIEALGWLEPEGGR